MAYAETTTVSEGSSMTHISELVDKHDAAQFLQARDGNRVIIGFTMQNRQVRFTVNFSEPDDWKFTHTEHASRGLVERTEARAKSAYNQHRRQRMRALFLVIKAKLESVDSGVETFEEAFLANVVLPDGLTVGQTAQPAIAKAYSGEDMPTLLPDYSKGGK